MDQHSINRIFHRAFNGHPNFITPDRVRLGKRGRLVYEISSGTGFKNSPLYGVTVLELDASRRSDLSASFPSLAEAEAYVRRDFVA